ncbi:hypothetical protein VCHC56A2_3827, partial [Vibrio cholerae HC-56A2]
MLLRTTRTVTNNPTKRCVYK